MKRELRRRDARGYGSCFYEGRCPGYDAGVSETQKLRDDWRDDLGEQVKRLERENEILRNQLEEVWLPYPRRPELLVSNKGRIRFDTTNSGRLGNRGYITVWLKIDGTSRNLLLHRMVMEAHVGPCPEGMEINHINGIKTDNRLENLEYVTRSQNLKHARDLGLIPKRPNKRKLEREAKREQRRIKK